MFSDPYSDARKGEREKRVGTKDLICLGREENQQRIKITLGHKRKINDIIYGQFLFFKNENLVIHLK